MQIASVHRGTPVSYEELAQKIVKVDSDRTMTPRQEARNKYEAAKDTYRRRLQEIYFRG